MSSGRVPHKCPVCEGRGRVPYNFYEDKDVKPNENGDRESCRTCDGFGVIWSNEDPTPPNNAPAAPANPYPWLPIAPPYYVPYRYEPNPWPQIWCLNEQTVH